MGDRGNIVIMDWKDPSKGVYLYSHWGGSRLPYVLAEALGSDAGKARATDAAYLTRIIFDTLTKGEQGEETGYGISTDLCDNSHPILVVDTVNGRVGVADEGKELSGTDGDRQAGCHVTYPFASFVNLIDINADPYESWANIR